MFGLKCHTKITLYLCFCGGASMVHCTGWGEEARHMACVPPLSTWGGMDLLGDYNISRCILVLFCHPAEREKAKESFLLIGKYFLLYSHRTFGRSPYLGCSVHSIDNATWYKLGGDRTGVRVPEKIHYLSFQLLKESKDQDPTFLIGHSNNGKLHCPYDLSTDKWMDLASAWMWAKTSTVPVLSPGTLVY